ncbi:MAG: bifunctional 5,10-methylenetetrahydrofolate dehydrogenase/5,10-methenyltetrahydrofolate cyclohydrolase [Rhodospirillaceae bacterium]
MRLIDGKAIAKKLNAATKVDAARLTEAGTTPKLAIAVPTDDESTAWYVRSIKRAAERLGLLCDIETLTGSTGPQICAALDRLSADPTVHGIICQTPLPEGVTLLDVAGHIVPEKDIDGTNPQSIGRLAAGLPTFAPATAQAVLDILKAEKIPLSGANVVVVGRSMVVGKPAALLLTAEDATVTVCHSRSRDLPGLCRQADILVAAVGRPQLLTADYVRKDAVIIDVGTNPTPEGGLVGDVDPDSVAPIAGALTPVPGGVGPVTTALLLRHVIEAVDRTQEGATA